MISGAWQEDSCHRVMAEATRYWNRNVFTLLFEAPMNWAGLMPKFQKALLRRFVRVFYGRAAASGDTIPERN
jgi:hypothetical protein